MVKRQSRTRQCRNKKLPDGLTEQLIARIEQLQESVKANYLREHYLTKYVSDDTDPAHLRRQRAIEKWLLTERDNASTNERLLITPEDYQLKPLQATFGVFVSFCQDLIREIVGDTVPTEALLGSFSGGASTSRNRTESHPAQKYLGEAHVTQRCKELFEDLIVDELPLWLAGRDAPSLKVVPGNVLFTVPKKATIDRCACKEPDINMFIQKGVGNHFRQCLRRIGINLNDQSRNRSLARVGSIDGSLATLDLSSASDSVSEGLVALLLPECWYSTLDALRCQVTLIDGVEHRNEMFSSMGNGFTFELESLLFYVLARATAYFTGTRGIVSVYGDDLIVPSPMAGPFEEVLAYFGFTVNSEKSFSEGPFRESCGGHYHDGFDITPFYIRAPLKHLTDLIHVANQLREWGTVKQLAIIDPEVEDIWLWLKGYVPRVLWGGEDTSFKFQLVSNDLPIQRLQPETKKRDTGLGGYFHWLNATMARQPLNDQGNLFGGQLKARDGVQTSSYKSEIGRFRLRDVRNPTVPRLPALFLSELGLTSE